MTELWCIHVHGPDDLIPMPDREFAEQKLIDFEVGWAKHLARHPDWGLTEHPVEIMPWPHTAAEHAEDLAKLREDDPNGWLTLSDPAPAEEEHAEATVTDPTCTAVDDGEISDETWATIRRETREMMPAAEAAIAGDTSGVDAWMQRRTGEELHNAVVYSKVFESAAQREVLRRTAEAANGGMRIAADASGPLPPVPDACYPPGAVPLPIVPLQDPTDGESEASGQRDDMRYPAGRPGWLGSAQPWPCGRCGTEADDEERHPCRAKEADR